MILEKFFDSVNEGIQFVNENIEFNERSAVKYKKDQQRSLSYSQRADKFCKLKELLESLPDFVKNPATRKSSPIYLSPEDIEGLPDELLKELNISDSDRKDFVIVDIINQLGGVASVDKILIEYFRRTKEIEKRQRMVSRLYRMGNRGLVYSADGKGVYSTSPVQQKKGGNSEE